MVYNLFISALKMTRSRLFFQTIVKDQYSLSFNKLILVFSLYTYIFIPPFEEERVYCFANVDCSVGL